ncbi:MAG: exodeoxyribonuclease VII small subunit ['Candidatus Kapabacteria' thiocyanatum]|uniref:Exodeoxyribonuclease 7 small subunit n=1 Tax=Candidatus Kapaibacterium thiocyanatum TaxID=1895771 RepID=A0A1M3KXR2_9BACT|nr:exodeoxyribonuclease VII small subunit ['Candidatus Kapabacteria' thiocyanatum]OJX57177.1 MAG: exodeoxyribonuclease VII small subunit ['Candidatus Kapabacteria' thiocyanatum]
MAKTKEQPSLEDQLRRLEDIARMLDAGDQPLDAQLKAFEEGMKLAADCRSYLTNAELTIERLTGDVRPEA